MAIPLASPLCQHYVNAINGATVSSSGRTAAATEQVMVTNYTRSTAETVKNFTHTRMFGNTEVGIMTYACQVMWVGFPEVATPLYLCSLTPLTIFFPGALPAVSQISYQT